LLQQPEANVQQQHPEKWSFSREAESERADGKCRRERRLFGGKACSASVAASAGVDGAARDGSGVAVKFAAFSLPVLRHVASRGVSPKSNRTCNPPPSQFPGHFHPCATH